MPSKGDVEFGSLAIREKLSTKERVEECSKYQEEVEKDGRQIGYAEYHLIGKGGYSMMKWQGVKTKMNPVIDALLQSYKP